MPNQPYDLLVIGSGPGGSGAAGAAAKAGHRVALVERDQLGGTCLNYGCDPTKTLLHAAHVLHTARQAERYSLRIPQADVDWPAMQARVRKLVDHIRGGSDEQARKDMHAKQGIDVFKGEARFRSPHEVAVGEQRLHADRIVIATGSEAVVPDVRGLRETGFLTNKEAIWLDRLPRSLAIIGGGPIGVEFAQMLRQFGVQVTLLQHGPTLLPKDDPELTELLGSLLERAGITITYEVELLHVQRDGDRKRLVFGAPDQHEQSVDVDEILVAAGYKPKLEPLDLDAAGVETTKRGIKVDATMRTSVPHIWAIGDAAGGYQFTHVASAQGELVARNAFAATPAPFDDRAIPWVTYVMPELAHVGKTEAELRDSGVRYTVGRAFMRDVERAMARGQTDGLVKLLVGADDQILGGHILADSAGELIAPIVLAMRAGIPAAALADAILPYPTLAEALRSAASDARKS